MTATGTDAYKAIRSIPDYVLFTESQMMWFVKDYWKVHGKKTKKLWVDLETVQRTLDRMLHYKCPYIFQSHNEAGETVYWRDAAALPRIRTDEAPFGRCPSWAMFPCEKERYGELDRAV